MSILVDVLIVLANVASAISLFLGYRELKTLQEASTAAASKAGELLDRINLVHECTLILGQNQNEGIIPRVDAISANVAAESNAIRADVAALGKQFGDFAYGTRVLNSHMKAEAAAQAVQEAERARIAAHRLAQATPTEPVTAQLLAARRKASGLIAPGEVTLPGGSEHPQNLFGSKQ